MKPKSKNTKSNSLKKKLPYIIPEEGIDLDKAEKVEPYIIPEEEIDLDKLERLLQDVQSGDHAMTFDGDDEMKVNLGLNDSIEDILVEQRDTTVQSSPDIPSLN